MLLGYTFLVEAFHDVEGFEVLFYSPEQVAAALADTDAVAVAEDVVDYGGHAFFAGKVGGSIEFC